MFNRVIRAILASMIGTPLVVSAQTARIVPAAANPDAAVAPLHYRSVFADTLPAAEPSQTPDKNWIQANRAVAGDTPAPPRPDTAVPAELAASPASGPAAGTHVHQKGG